MRGLEVVALRVCHWSKCLPIFLRSKGDLPSCHVVFNITLQTLTYFIFKYSFAFEGSCLKLHSSSYNVLPYKVQETFHELYIKNQLENKNLTKGKKSSLWFI